jgi:hypothetical protein
MRISSSFAQYPVWAYGFPNPDDYVFVMGKRRSWHALSATKKKVFSGKTLNSPQKTQWILEWRVPLGMITVLNRLKT